MAEHQIELIQRDNQLIQFKNSEKMLKENFADDSEFVNFYEQLLEEKNQIIMVSCKFLNFQTFSVYFT